MRLRPALALLAPAGVVAGHAFGHLVAPGHAGNAVDHGYLGLAAVAAGPLALVALAWAGARGRQTAQGETAQRAARPVPLGALLAAQCLLFGGQEAIEHAVAGHGPADVLASGALWAGLAAQVATALVLVLLVRAATTTGARLAGVVAARPVIPGLPVSGRCHAAGPAPLRSRPVTSVASRGPPVLSAA